jgi:outer membrane protein assembly factor BamB
LSKGPKKAWDADVGKGYSSVAVVNGRVYTMGNKANRDTVYCLSESDGREIWRHTYPCKGGQYPGPRCTPTVDGTSVYTVSYEGLVSCLGDEKGNILWKRDLATELGARPPKWGFATSALIEGNMVVLNACTRGVALDKKTGRKVWASPGGVAGYATPVVFSRSGRKCAAIFGQKALYGVDLMTGKELFRYPWETDYDVNAADPVYSEGKLFISSGYRRGCTLLDVARGGARKIWESRQMSNHFGTCVLMSGYLYGITGNTGRGSLVCLGFKSGRQKWSKKLGFGGWSAAGDKLIVLTERGELIVAKADPSGYREISRGRALKPKGKCWQMPVLVNGRIYCRSGGGQLVCIDVSK